jgi:hydrogenase expression/formation protein HypE
MAKILLAHGSGGRLTHDFIENVILKKCKSPALKRLTDSAVLKLKKGKEIAFTTDSFVVNPVFFRGGDIGKLAVCGTVNDLAVCGAEPLYISCSLIIEEGVEASLIERVIDSMSREARAAGVEIVTGDTKVVEKGSADKVFINTSGIGIVKYKKGLLLSRVKPGDKVVINGPVADHGIAVLAAREKLGLKSTVKSDCASLNRMILKVLDRSDVKFMRDPTRGGVATTMNEIAMKIPLGIRLFEKDIPFNEGTRSACELLGLDPLYVGNEGKVIMVLSEKEAVKAVKTMKRDRSGRRASVIGEVTKEFKGKVVLHTKVGGERIIDMLSKEALPRIC